MNDENLRELIRNLPDDVMPDGHLDRFRDRLRAQLPLQRKLWNVQRIVTAASVILFIAGTVFFLVNREMLRVLPSVFTENSSHLNETEIYLKNEINLRIQELTKIGQFDPEVLAEISSEDASFQRMRSDLRKNPGDVRLTSAIRATYQLKLEVLDNMIEQVR
jgi:hypothetical protein